MNIKKIVDNYFGTNYNALNKLSYNIVSAQDKKTNKEKGYDLFITTYTILIDQVADKNLSLEDAIRSKKLSNYVSRIMKLQYIWADTDFKKYQLLLHDNQTQIIEDEELFTIKTNQVDIFNDGLPTYINNESLYNLIEDIFVYCDKKKQKNEKNWDKFVFFKMYYKYDMNQRVISNYFTIPISTIRVGIKYARNDINIQFKDRIEALKDNNITRIN